MNYGNWFIAHACKILGVAHKFGSDRRLVCTILWLHGDDLYRISPDKAWIHGSESTVSSIYKYTHYPHYDLHAHPTAVLLRSY